MQWRYAGKRVKGVAKALAAVLTLVGGIGGGSGEAAADDSAYCRKVKARAAGDAALLFAPSVTGQVIRYPSVNGGPVDSTGVTTGNGWQGRVGLSWSPLDFYRGFGVLRAGDADCERGNAQIDAQHLLHYGEDYGRLHALKKQAEYLDGRAAELTELGAKNDERLAAHVTSMLDANEVKARIAELGRKAVQAKAEAAILDARGVEAYRGMLDGLVAQVESSSMKYEREVSHLRDLDGFDVRLTGGVVPHDKAEVYGVLQVGFNFGSLARIPYEAKYLDARAEELKKARYELRDQLMRFREQVRIAAVQASKELQIVTSKLTTLKTARDALKGSESPNAPHAIAVVELELVGAESEQVFLTALVSELSSLEDRSHGK
jgi:hypothetical protein